MKITILAVGKLKEKYLVQGMQEFIKRLKPYCSLEILEVSENALPEKFSAAQLQEHLEIEAQKILKLVPEAKVSYAHGKMSGNELENIMLDFINGETNVLVCTTILESGIDIPNANTIIVENADRLGLAQLYRGE